MEDDEHDNGLAMDEKETSETQFVPEDKFEHIWNQEPLQYDEKSSSEENLDKSTVEPSEKINGEMPKTPAKSDLESERETFYDSELMKAPAKIADKFDEIVRVKSNLCKGCFGNVYQNICYVALIMTNLMVKLLGNRWAWNIFMVVSKISIAVFLYLVIAVSTAIIAIIFNIHDAYVQLKIERNHKCCTSDKSETLPNNCWAETGKREII